MNDIEGWRKSSYSTSDGGNCVEIGQAAITIAVRDTKNQGEGPTLEFTRGTWREFVHQVKKSLHTRA